MKDLKQYLSSGILEEFVLGLTSVEENCEVLRMISEHEEVKDEVNSITNSLLQISELVAPPLDPTIKPMVLAIIDYTTRLQNGEEVTFPPELGEHSSIEDYAQWITRQDLMPHINFDEYDARLIGYTPTMTTALVSIRTGSPEETHHELFEKFLILEGSCDIMIDNTIHSLFPGDYLSIPLHAKHKVQITSLIPCRAILQRVAA